MGYTGRVQFENRSHKKVPAVYNSREKSVRHVHMINEKSTDPIQKFYPEGEKIF